MSVKFTGSKPAVKILITGLLLAVLFFQMNWAEVAHLLTRLNPFLLSIAFGTVLAAVVLSAYKWQLLLVARGWNLPVTTLTRVYFIGLFFNNFLPSSIGGDLLRIYRVGKAINNNSEAAASVVLERLLATVGLLLLALLALLPNYRIMGSLTKPVFLVLGGLVLGFMVLAKPELLKPLAGLPWRWWQIVIGKLRGIYDIIKTYRAKPGTLMVVIFYSVLFQLTIVIINYCLLRAMGIGQVSLWQCALMVPVISAVSMLPLSINGLGIREGAYVLLFNPLGLTASQAVTLSMLFFMLVLIASLLGGLFFATERVKSGLAISR